jgi:hypothetical protein
MQKTKFLSKEVSLKRVGILSCFFIIAPILLLIIGSHCYEVVDKSLRSYYQEECNEVCEAQKNQKPLVLGAADISNLSKDDYAYYEGADVYITGTWEPVGYIKMDRTIDNPKYDVQDGTIVKDSFDIGIDDTLNLICGEIDESDLEFPPYEPSCILNINDYRVLSTEIRSTITCDDYGDYDDDNIHPSGCKQEVGIVLYEDPNLKYKYLFVSSAEFIGSPYSFWAYELHPTTFSQLFFDFRDSISEDKMTRGGMTEDNFYLAFTDETEKDFRLVTYFYDPAMGSVSAIYDEWRVENSRFMLDKKIVSVYK